MPLTRTRLDNPAFAGRLCSARSTYERRAVSLPTRSRMISDMRRPTPGASSLPKAAPVAKAAPALPRTPKSAAPRPERSRVLKRQGFMGRPRSSFSPRPKRGWGAKALPALAVLLFICGLAVAGIQLRTNEQVKAQVKQLTVHTEDGSDDTTDADGLPSEQKPEGSLNDYRVASHLPRVLTIPKAGVETRVVRTGIKANNELKAPVNIFDAGWYEGSALPGESGAVLLAGHVHGPTSPGVFINLKKLRAGDTITMERGDGKQFTYKVVKSQSYDADKVDMGAAFSSVVPGKPGLNIITCEGDYDEAGNYNKRLVVFAVQM